jgi:hypothetical protein
MAIINVINNALMDAMFLNVLTINTNINADDKIIASNMIAKYQFSTQNKVIRHQATNNPVG